MLRSDTQQPQGRQRPQPPQGAQGGEERLHGQKVQERQQKRMQLGVQVRKLSEGRGVLPREGTPTAVEPGPMARVEDEALYYPSFAEQQHKEGQQLQVQLRLQVERLQEAKLLEGQGALLREGPPKAAERGLIAP